MRAQLLIGIGSLCPFTRLPLCQEPMMQLLFELRKDLPPAPVGYSHS
jgi:hypothetical protein